MKIVKGQVLPLGITIEENSVNFAVEVELGSTCELKLFKSSEEEPSYIYEMPEDRCIKGIRCIKLIDIDEEISEYIYEIDQKSYVDPYALEITGRKEWGEQDRESVHGKIIKRKYNQDETFAPIKEHDVIAYRLHVRGFTKHMTSKVKAKGCFTGLIEKIPYFRELGINQIQLLPSYEFIEEGMKLNYWGYALGYYKSPKSSYCLTDNAVEEFQELIRSFHANGLEIILDMPFIDGCSLSYQLECLRYYVLEFQVDGFVLNPYITNIDEIKKDPVLRYVKIITQTEEFLITMRKFLKGDEGIVRDAMWQLRKLTNSSGVSSYNYMANHNGFTMADMVSYDGKHNEANGEKNQDGTEYNYCWNCGAEGSTRKKIVLELRKKQMRNAWALLMLAQGTPCILAGDEFANSQKGNNNAYCQDNEISWLDWRLLKKNQELHTFVKSLIKLRKKHPVLHQALPLQGMDSCSCGLPDVSYHGESAWITPNEVSSRQLGVLYSGKGVGDVDCYIAYNMHWIEHEYALPTLQQNKKWYQVLDTNTGNIGEETLLLSQRLVTVTPRSIAMYISR